MNHRTEKLFPLLGLLLLVSAGFNVYLLAKSAPEDGILFSLQRHRESINLPLNQSTNCSFDAEMNVTYKDGKIEYKSTKNEEGTNISFVDLDTDNPKMRGNAGQDDLLKIVDNDEVVTMIEKSPIAFGTQQSFTIFKATGVGIWTKQYNLANQIPFGLLSMGYCD